MACVKKSDVFNSPQTNFFGKYTTLAVLSLIFSTFFIYEKLGTQKISKTRLPYNYLPAAVITGLVRRGSKMSANPIYQILSQQLALTCIHNCL